MRRRLSNGMLLSHDQQWVTSFNNKLHQPHNQKLSHVSEVQATELHDLQDVDFNLLIKLVEKFRTNPNKDNFGADNRTRDRWRQQQHQLDTHNHIQANLGMDYQLSYMKMNGELDPTRPRFDENWIKKHHYNQWWIMYKQSDKFKRTTMQEFNMRKLKTAKRNIRKLKSRVDRLVSRERAMRKKLVKHRFYVERLARHHEVW